MKVAMKARDAATLRGLRAIKAALLLLNTQEGKTEVTEADELSALAKMAKQRKDSIQIYKDQGRDDLQKVEEDELAVIQKFLPAQLSGEEVKSIVLEIISSSGASSMKDMGKVMGMANGKLKGRADGKLISEIVKQSLS